MPSYAINDAQYLSEIGFPEFTTKLISDVFDTLISANMAQTEMYIDLVTQISKTLTTFINDTRDDISGEMVLQFLAQVAPDNSSSYNTIVRKDNDAPLGAAAATLNEKLAIEGYGEQTTFETADNIKEKYDVILKAVANRLAADKYTILKEMVKLGIMRVVVNEGEIETSLNFKTYASNFYNYNAQSYDRSEFSASASAQTGRFLSRWIKASASTNYTSVSVDTSNYNTGGNTGTSIVVTGRVKINFKTDYQALTVG